MATMRAVILVVVAKHWTIHQMDIYNAFLLGNLNEEVYMTVLNGFNHTGGSAKVYKLLKSLYSLKQASR